MSTTPFSLRMNKTTLNRLAAGARERDEPMSRLAQRYIEEGLRMDEHPGIVFQDGPSGRRARLLGGPDIWEVVSIMSWFDGTPDEIVQQTMEMTGLDARSVDIVLRYYAEHRDETDGWVRRNYEESDRAFVESQRTQVVLRH